MRINVLVLTVAALLACVAGCKASSHGGGKPKSIEGVTWQLTEVGGMTAEPVPTDARAAGASPDSAASIHSTAPVR